MDCVLGIDTSCYTTSIAVLTVQGELLANARQLLQVKPGKRGLAQSEMVYQHVRALPTVFEQAGIQTGRINVKSVGVSVRPRPQPGSYMPAFLVGLGYAKVLAQTLGIPLYESSHQENHIYAGMWSAKGPKTNKFLALHVSGGTTEILQVERLLSRLDIKLLGGTADLHAGQFVDRVGVALGFGFPAGPKLEKLACIGHASPAYVPIAVNGLTASFSGPATHVQRMIDKGTNPAEVAAGVECCLAGTLIKLIEAAANKSGLTEVLLVGGVTANSFIRRTIQSNLSTKGLNVYMPDGAYSSDNAVGNAYYALSRLTNGTC